MRNVRHIFRKTAQLLEDFDSMKTAIRALRRAPAFTSVIVLTLGISAAANLAVFSVVDAMLLKAMPYASAERIVLPWRHLPPGMSLGYSEIPWGEFEVAAFQSRPQTFEHVGAFKSAQFNLGDGIERLDGIRASAGFFRVLGTAPLLGRVYDAEDDRAGHDHVVVLGYGVWQRRFGGDRHVIGRTIHLNGEPYAVVGVMPRGFAFPRGADMPASFEFAREPVAWVPLALPPSPRRGLSELAVIARLTAGTTLAQAQNELDAAGREVETQFPASKGWFNGRVVALGAQIRNGLVRPLLMLQAAAGLIWLIACANIANLMLTRAVDRQRDSALRVSLGATTRHLMRDWLAESGVLAVGGTTVGLLLASSALRLIAWLGSSQLPRVGDAALDSRSLLFAALFTALTTIAIAVLPALRARTLGLELRGSAQRTGVSPAHLRQRHVLLATEVAISVVVVITSALLLQSYAALSRVRPGFDARHALTLEVTLPSTTYPDRQHIIAFYDHVLETIRQMPQVAAAGAVNPLPMSGSQEASVYLAEGRPASAPADTLIAAYTMASAGYLDALGIPLVRGRAFTMADSSDAPAVTIINESMAKLLWPGRDPIGRRIRLPPAAYPWMTVVGVIPDIKRLSLRDQPTPEMLVPIAQKTYPSMQTMQLVIRTNMEPMALAPTVGGAIRAIDASVALARVAPMEQLVSSSLTWPRMWTTLLAAFAAIALVLAFIGIYGAFAYAVSQRTHEIGIRVALGAPRRQVARLIVGGGAVISAVGIAAGLGVSAIATGAIGALLFGVTSTDASTFAAVSVAVFTITLLACYVPARRAMRIDPMTALRAD
jgi:predicted permease